MTTEATQSGVEVNENYKSRMSAIDAIADDMEEEFEAEEPEEEQEELEPEEAEEPAEEEQEQEPVAEPEAKKETRKIKVDGQEKEVSIDEIIAAGTRALQKESAADARLAEATRLLNEAKQQKQQPSVEDVATQRATQDAELSQIVRAIQVGTEEEAAQALQYLMERQRTTPDQIATVAVTQVQAMLEARDTQSKFMTSFPEIAKDQRLYQLAAQEVQRRLEAGEANSWETYEAAGKEIESWFKVPKADTSMQAKEQKKRTVTTLPSAGGKLPNKPDEKPETVSDVLNEMRKARKQL